MGSLIETSPTKYNWNCLIYLAEIPFQPAPPCNEGQLKWVKVKDLLDVPTPPTDLAIYKYVLESKPFMLNAVFDVNMNLISMREEIEKIVIVGN